MQADIGGLMLGNLVFSMQIAPFVLVAVTVLRGLILLSGQKREFEDWTRNPLMSLLSIIFLPGALAYIVIRYVVSKAFGIKVENIGSSTTYGEINLFLKVDRPPRVVVVLSALYIIVVLSVFVALSLIFLPAVYFLDNTPGVVFCWYVAVGVLFNNSLRSGDVSLVIASLRRRPRTGVLEFIAVLVTLIILYTQVIGVMV
ncbi:MAG: hypothetical protein RTU09_04105 [Candidatus Thorarchaeota archaeon]